jgi:DNA-binding MarR family transcriptional regulator
MTLNARNTIHDKKIMSSTDQPTWTFLSNHAQVLLCITRDPNIRIRDIAPIVGITERAAARIVSDLVAAGYLNRTKIGRRNHYQLNGEARMRHAAQADNKINDLLDIFGPPAQH